MFPVPASSEGEGVKSAEGDAMSTAGWKIELLRSLQVVVAGGMLATVVVTLFGIVARGIALAT